MRNLEMSFCFDVKEFSFENGGFEQPEDKMLQKPRCSVTGAFVGHLETFVPAPPGYDEMERWKDEVGLYAYI